MTSRPTGPVTVSRPPAGAARLNLIPLGFALALGLLGGMEWLSFQHTTRAVQIAALLTSTHRARDAMNQLEAHILEVEEWRWRRPQQSSAPPPHASLDDALRAIEREQLALETVVLHPEQKANVVALKPLIEEWVEAVRASEGGEKGVATADDRSLLALNAIKSQFGRMDRRGRDFVTERSLVAREESGRARVLTAAGAAMAFTLLVAVFALLRRENRMRQKAQEALDRLNTELSAQAAKLQAANQELESFSYSVSHDLRTPLRALDGFSEAIAEDYGGALDAKGKDYLRRIRAAAQRMGQLIDDLLDLSRVTRTEMVLEDVDLSALANRVAADLPPVSTGRTVEWDIAQGLRAHGDPRLLQIALENFLGNAVKFTGKKEIARVSFGQDPDGESPFFVRDNGAGFDMAYAGRIFGAFQRLHTVSEFPGSGVGLATVQRIVHRHGGRVWATGEPGKGATFYFTLPPPSITT